MNQKKKLSKYIAGVFFAFVLVAGMLLTNGQKASAATKKPYLIKVNKIKNCITIYEQDKNGEYTKPIKAMACSTGAKTPTGTFRTMQKYEWKILLDDVWGQYCTRIVKDILFHSVYYYSKSPSDLAWRQYNNLGIMCSHGCIRLSVKDAKWIYDHCGLGTTVKIYNSSNPGPLGKPESIKLKAGTRWDPSDTGKSANPFNNKKPSIKGAKNRTYEYGEKINLLDGIKAYNTTGFNRTDLVKVRGKVNNKKAGKYKITYVMKDELGRTAKKKVTITIKQEPDPIVISGVTNREFPKTVSASEMKKTALKGVSAKSGSKKIAKSKIKVTYKKVASKNNYIEYKVTYKVTLGIKTKTATARFYLDRKAPVIKGNKDRIISSDEFNEAMANNTFVSKLALEGVTVSDNLTKLKKSNITVKAVNNNNGTYTINYTVSDKAGNKTSVSSVYTVLSDITVAPKNANNININTEAEMTSDLALQNVKITANGKDFTNQFVSKSMVTAKIQRAVENNQVVFHVTYEVKILNKTFASTTTANYYVAVQ
ncbi:choline binding protein A [Lachnospiraceae bacterium KM106-2]|nr:choline binding protein A [Lachnospiraceae bacterium KM106-2]